MGRSLGTRLVLVSLVPRLLPICIEELHGEEPGYEASPGINQAFVSPNFYLDVEVPITVGRGILTKAVETTACFVDMKKPNKVLKFLSQILGMHAVGDFA